MRRRRIRHNVDPNQKEIVAGLRKAGFSVEIIGDPVDILVGGPGRNVPMEIKKDHEADLTPAQVQFFDTWKGPRALVTTLEEALQAMGWASSQ